MAIETEPLSVPLRVTALEGNTLQFTHRTKPLHLIISGNHSELTSFLVFSTSNSPIILRFKWLQQHNPRINSSDKHVESWSTICHSSCLCSAVPPAPPPAVPQEAEPSDLSTIPLKYHNIAPVFSKSKALSLTPH